MYFSFKLRVVPMWCKSLLVAFFAAAFSFISNSSWRVDPFGWVDQWGYWGLSRYFPELALAKADLPSTELLPVYLPGALLGNIFDASLANVVLDFAMLLASNFFLYSLTSRFTNRKLGIVALALAALHQYYLSTIGSSYPVAYVSVYLMACLYFTMQAVDVSDNRMRNKCYSFLVGFFAILMISSAILSAIYAALIFALAIALFAIKDRSSYFRAYLMFLRTASLGALFSVLILQFAHLFIGEGFYLSSNIEKLLGFTIGNAYRAPDPKVWLADASWLILPFAVAIASILELAGVVKTKSRFENRHAFVAFAVSLLLALSLVNIFVNQWSLQFLYFNQIISVFLVAQAVLLGERIASRLFSFSLVILIALNGISTYLLSEYTFTYDSIRRLFLADDGYWSQLVFLLSAVLVYALGLFLFREKNFLKLIGIFIVGTLSIYTFSPTYGCFLCLGSKSAEIELPAYAANSHVLLENTRRLSDHLVHLDPDLQSKIWFNELSEVGPLIRQAQAAAYLNDSRNRVSKSFPRLVDKNAPIGSEGSSVFSGDRIVLVAEDISQYAPVNEALSSIGMRVDKAEWSSVRLTDGREVLFYEFFALADPGTAENTN